MAIVDEIKTDLERAMRAGEKERVGALRLVVSELQKAAKEGSDDELAVLRRERKRRLEAARAYHDAGREDLAGREETLFSTKNAYSAVAADVGYTVLPSPVGSGYYTISVAVTAPGVNVAPAFTVTAVPSAGSTQLQDTACQSFTVDQLGNQTALDSGGADNTSTCWGN